LAHTDASHAVFGLFFSTPVYLKIWLTTLVNGAKMKTHHLPAMTLDATNAKKSRVYLLNMIKEKMCCV
jgi:hypothetical protein